MLSITISWQPTVTVVLFICLIALPSRYSSRMEKQTATLDK